MHQIVKETERRHLLFTLQIRLTIAATLLMKVKFHLQRHSTWFELILLK